MERTFIVEIPAGYRKFSMGGMGTWQVATRYPDIFAAAAPLLRQTRSLQPGHRTVIHVDRQGGRRRQDQRVGPRPRIQGR